ncbi:ARM repeat-containing protein [Tothia fuscella]|uniref:Nucleolar protein 9 n=1 Tax=Tothia fuscella TaxID=1048955 RepID=A0A9P4U2A4_9PEZI|nr:ARM repeat-containing protein [Tothia fuscella]
MPKEGKKRGRRGEKKRKLEQSDEEIEHTHKKHKHDKSHSHVESTAPADFVPLENGQHQDNLETQDATSYSQPGEMPFYGMLDEEEQEYFKRADEMLELNDFANAEDRSIFLANVYKEAEGKELKLANSQSCSRLMERLIRLSTADQLKGLFGKFSTHFLHLVQHRFASHCCEALFIQGAPVVTAEMLAPPFQSTGEEPIPSMESLFLQAIHELEEFLGYLLTDKFASHTLRVLLVVLSGQPLEQSASKSMIQSKKKEHITVHSSNELTLEQRKVPESFLAALQDFISKCVSGLDTTYIRALASHPSGNPTIQLLLQLELTQFGKQKAKDENSIIHKLLPDDPITPENDSGKFINGMLYDSVGSRLLETIIEHAPGKTFKSIYRQMFKGKLGTLSKNDTASYVVSKILIRLSKDDLADAVQEFCPQIQLLVDRNRTVVIKTLIERCAVRSVDPTPIATAIEAAYSGPKGFEITHLLRLNKTGSAAPSTDPAYTDSPTSNKPNTKDPEKLHGSLLAQTMLTIPGPTSDLIFDSLAQLGTPLSISLAKDSTASRTIQAALSAPIASVIFRRKMIQQFYGHIGELALDPSASRVIDAIWAGTNGLAFIRERIAEELAENEAALRESFVGRAVWRNWRMDLYKRKRHDWVLESRKSAGDGGGFLAFPETELVVDMGKENRHMSAIDKARLKHARDKGKGEGEW